MKKIEMPVVRVFLYGLIVSGLAACASGVPSPAPQLTDAADHKPLHQDLLELPPPDEKVHVAVYGFPDLTGQFKPSETVQTLSRAVTQGAEAVLIQALQDAGKGSWFTVVERNNLENLIKERTIIRETRQGFLGRDGKPLPPPPPLLYAGIIVEGGIIGFDTNRLTGGFGARLLGIGGNVEYREDIVTIYLRAVSTQNGQVLKSLHVSKRILSYGVSFGVFKFIDTNDLLEIETGFSVNEPNLVALRQAIELAVYALVIDGAESKMWAFNDEQKAAEVKDDLTRRKNSYSVNPQQKRNDPDVGDARKQHVFYN